MIKLGFPTSLQVITAGAISPAQVSLDTYVSFTTVPEMGGGTPTFGQSAVNISSDTTTTLIANTSNLSVIQVMYCSLVNRNLTESVQVVVQFFDSVTAFDITATYTLGPGASLTYVSGEGWRVVEPAPDNGNALIVPLHFSFGDVSPELIYTIGGGLLVLSATILINTPFNGTGAALSIGDSVNNQRIMPTTQNNPAVAGQYATEVAVAYGFTTPINLYITPGSGASAGSGTVILQVQI